MRWTEVVGMRWLVIVLGFAVVWGCGDHQPTSAQGVSEWNEQVLQADRRFDASCAAGQRGAFAGLIAEDAVFLGGTTLRGRKEIVEGWSPFLDSDGRRTLRWRPVTAEVSASGDLAYTLGEYRMETVDDEGRIQVSTGEYLTVWRRGPDGRWRAAADSGTVPRPVTEVEPAPSG